MVRRILIFVCVVTLCMFAAGSDAEDQPEKHSWAFFLASGQFRRVNPQQAHCMLSPGIVYNKRITIYHLLNATNVYFWVRPSNGQ